MNQPVVMRVSFPVATAGILLLACGASDALGPINLATRDSCVYPAHFGDYMEQEVDLGSLDALPQGIRTGLNAYLTSRLGDPLLRSLKFREGAFIDPAAVPDVVRSELELRREFVAYVVLFSVSLPGGQEYCTGVHLTADGRVALGIGLPNIVANPDKSVILSEAEALEVATGLGVSQERATRRLSYNPQIDSLVWEVSEPTGHQHNRALIRTCHINAHTGKLLGWSNGEVRFCPVELDDAAQPPHAGDGGQGGGAERPQVACARRA